jgi:hypothetical protein
MAHTLTFDFDFTTHLFDQVLADTEAQSRTLIIQAFLIRQFTEIQKQFVLVLLIDASS